MISARTVAVVVASLLALIPACTSEQAKAASDLPTTGTSAAVTTTESNLTPGGGEKIRMGRAQWDSGALHAQIIRDLLEELGYQVDDPDDHELSVDFAYQAMSEGDIDFWANSWYPSDEAWWEGETRVGDRVGDHLTRVDEPIMASGGLQGLLVSKSWAEANGVTTLDQIAEDETLWTQLDYDNDGIGELFGCPVDWSCDDQIQNSLICNDWQRLEQISDLVPGNDVKTSESKFATYDTLFETFIERAEAGEPAIAYVWTPTHYYAQANLGETTMWLSMRQQSVIRDCDMRHGVSDQYSQHGRGGAIGYSDLRSDICLKGPDGCQIGWLGADIEITANRQWLAANPAAEALLNQVRFDIDEISALLLELENTDNQSGDLERLSEQWITSNQPVVDRWLDSARKAN